MNKGVWTKGSGILKVEGGGGGGGGLKFVIFEDRYLSKLKMVGNHFKLE